VIPLESIRVSRRPCPEVDPPDSVRVTVEWCVTGDPERDPWCATKARHIHHRAASSVVAGHIFTSVKHKSWGWSCPLLDPFADDQEALFVHSGWLHPADLKVTATPGWHAELYLPNNDQKRLKVIESHVLLGCSRENRRFYDHICLVREEPAA
jgi:hypothetical protein